MVSGSLAYDKIMNFPGRFSDHILPDQIHNLNLSFSLSDSRTSFGGTAGNIAYNLALLKEKPIILGVVGSDFDVYGTRLLKFGLDISLLKKDLKESTAAAYIITDSQDNQIASFHPGPLPKNYAGRTADRLVRSKKIDLAIIAPDNKERMLSYAAVYQKRHVPYVFDPGQALTSFTAKELQAAIQGAKILIGNDYEINLIAQRLKINLPRLAKLVEILVITKGEKGSEIYQGAQKTIILPAKPLNTSDPTGAGDAYRAGLIKGLIRGYNLKTCGQLAGLIAVYTVEKHGTQTHSFTIKELAKRYQKNYREKIVIN